MDFIRPHLLHAEALDYEAAVARLTGAGYALWDSVAASTRKGSLDTAIRDAECRAARNSPARVGALEAVPR